MKTAEECDDNIIWNDKTQRAERLKIIKDIQLDAFKQGMTEAYHIAGSTSKEILRIRDNTNNSG